MSADLTDAEFRLRYSPMLDQIEGWRKRLNKALGIDPQTTMEDAVVCVERDTGANVLAFRKRPDA
jgi:hypothetical protein